MPIWHILPDSSLVNAAFLQAAESQTNPDQLSFDV
jgi:hypothetical protein